MHPLRTFAAALGGVALMFSQSPSNAVVINPDSAAWTHQRSDPEGSEFIMLHSDEKTGGMDLLARYPAGHAIAPHFHDSNERIIVVEGRLTLKREGGESEIKTGGFAFLPAGEAQRISCSSETRCTFYLMWDGKPQSHPVK